MMWAYMMAEVMHCPRCGSPNPIGAAKCSVCGYSFSQAPKANPAYSKVFSNTKMAVFDIDDTILDVSERFRSARRAGVVNDQGGPVRKGMNSGWQKRNDFLYREDMLDKDRVIAGSKDLISYLMKEGYSIAYCTSRDAKNREKTRVQLENKGFPLFKDDRGEILLFLKEGARRRMKGPAYKADVVSMLQGKYDVRLFFDDNKDNLIAVASLGVPGIYEKISDYWKMVSVRKNSNHIATLKQFVPIDEKAGLKYGAAGGAIVTGTANIDTAYQRMPDPDAEEVWDEEEQRFVRPIIAETSAPPVEEDRGSIQKRINPGHSCPAATQNLELNTKNRNKAIQADYIQYGPLNLKDTDGVLKYYQDIAKHWKTDVATAKASKCSNCVAFDISPRMLECMPGPVSEPIEDEEGYLGYCWMHHFKCHSARTCYTWAAGGPISKDKISFEWQERAFSGGVAKNPPPKPRKKGKRREPVKNYIRRFMGNDKMVKDFPDSSQRYAVALGYVEKFYGRAARDRVAPVRNNPAAPDKVKKGEKLYEHMNGKAPAKKTTEMIDIGDVWYQVGEGGCWQIGYMSGKETGKSSQKYVHTFNEETQDGNFPKLYATIPESGKPMLIIKGGTWKIKTDKEGVAWIYD